MSASVAPAYVHRDKRIMPGEAFALKGARFKWYEVALPDTPVPDDIRTMARAYVENVPFEGDFGFVTLHRCGGDFYFLIVQTWRYENEVWQSVYSKTKDDPGFHLHDRQGPHLPTFCVWELGVVWHEQGAWKRYLLSSRDEAAAQAWLNDRCEGAV